MAMLVDDYLYYSPKVFSDAVIYLYSTAQKSFRILQQDVPILL